MDKQEIIKAFEEIREVIIWNEIKDLVLTNESRKRAVIDIDSAIEAIKENGEE